MASKFYHIAQEMLGTTIGRWQVRGISGVTKGNILVDCLCECGTERSVRVSRLHSGKSQSCGCLRNDNLVVHGRTRNSIRGHSREYWVWNAMKNRCLNPNYKHFADYGGRGITVCDRWLEFKNFHEDMGEPEKGMMLERIDNDAGYSPENCCWANRTAQNRNKRNNRFITAGGETLTLAEWAKKTGITHSAILARIKSGWPEDLAATTGRRYN